MRRIHPELLTAIAVLHSIAPYRLTPTSEHYRVRATHPEKYQLQ
jgi:hypothetical protein